MMHRLTHCTLASCSDGRICLFWCSSIRSSSLIAAIEAGIEPENPKFFPLLALLDPSRNYRKLCHITNIVDYESFKEVKGKINCSQQELARLVTPDSKMRKQDQ